VQTRESSAEGRSSTPPTVYLTLRDPSFLALPLWPRSTPILTIPAFVPAAHFLLFPFLCWLALSLLSSHVLVSYPLSLSIRFCFFLPAHRDLSFCGLSFVTSNSGGLEAFPSLFLPVVDFHICTFSILCFCVFLFLLLRPLTPHRHSFREREQPLFFLTLAQITTLASRLLEKATSATKHRHAPPRETDKRRRRLGLEPAEIPDSKAEDLPRYSFPYTRFVSFSRFSSFLLFEFLHPHSTVSRLVHDSTLLPLPS
jgi:hypothetical protein